LQISEPFGRFNFLKALNSFPRFSAMAHSPPASFDGGRFLDDFGGPPSPALDVSPAALAAFPQTRSPRSPPSDSPFAPIADLSVLIRPPVPQLLNIFVKSQSAPDFQDGAPLPCHRRYVPNPVSTGDRPSLPMSPSECERSRARSRSARETVKRPLFYSIHDADGPGQSGADRKDPPSLLSLAAKIRSDSPEFDPARFKSNLRLSNTPERQFLDLLAPSGAGPFAELQQILAYQGLDQAIEFCAAQDLWAFALILANSISGDEFERVTELFLKRTFSEPTFLSSHLRFLSAPSDSDDWKFTLVSCLLNFDERAIATLRQLSQNLDERGDTEAAGVVRVFSDIPKRDDPVRPPPAAARPAEPKKDEKERWFDGFFKKLRKPSDSDVPPPPAVASPPEADPPKKGSRSRAKDRYVSPF
jgi:hypothetical protein